MSDRPCDNLYASTCKAYKLEYWWCLIVIEVQSTMPTGGRKLLMHVTEGRWPGIGGGGCGTLLRNKDWLQRWGSRLITRRLIVYIVAWSKTAVMKVRLASGLKERSKGCPYADIRHGAWPCGDVHCDARDSENGIKLECWLPEYAFCLRRVLRPASG